MSNPVRFFITLTAREDEGERQSACYDMLGHWDIEEEFGNLMMTSARTLLCAALREKMAIYRQEKGGGDD